MLRRILVVDDSFLGASLNYPFGFEVEQCLDVQEGLEAFRTRDYDVILLDHNMPGDNGDVFAKIVVSQGFDPRRIVRISSRKERGYPEESPYVGKMLTSTFYRYLRKYLDSPMSKEDRDQLYMWKYE